jgi:hypothetical protein
MGKRGEWPVPPGRHFHSLVFLVLGTRLYRFLEVRYDGGSLL